jgi:hypothetical protein
MKAVRAFAIGDATGDGRDDLVAVLVGEQGQGKVWHVVAFNGTATGFGPPQWMLKDHTHPIGMVTLDRRRRKVTVWECFECDFSPLFRWNGESFEEGLWANGDVLSGTEWASWYLPDGDIARYRWLKFPKGPRCGNGIRAQDW